jgi:AraC-like DNA-binding protein
MEIQIPLEVLDCAHVRADSRLLAILMRYADSQVTAMPERGDLISRTRQAIARQIARALPTLVSTAAQLRMPERTLQRLLAQTGVTYTSLLDEIRRELALKWIGDARLGMSEIGFLLHFSDTTGFYRAFKRWTGETPIEYRRHLFEVARPARQPKREEQSAPRAT